MPYKISVRSMRGRESGKTAFQGFLPTEGTPEECKPEAGIQSLSRLLAEQRESNR